MENHCRTHSYRRRESINQFSLAYLWKSGHWNGKRVQPIDKKDTKNLVGRVTKRNTSFLPTSDCSSKNITVEGDKVIKSNPGNPVSEVLLLERAVGKPDVPENSISVLESIQTEKYKSMVYLLKTYAI